MALFPRQGLGAALQEASPLLLGLSQGLLGGNYGGGLAMGVQGLQQKTQEREGNELFQGLFTQPTLSTMNAQPQGQSSGAGRGLMPFTGNANVSYGSAAPSGGTLGLLREFEGFRDKPYWDVNALRSGYGSDTVTLADGRVVPVTEGTRVTREDAERDLSRRVSTEFEPIAQRAVGEAWNGLGENQRAALTSIAYNYGRIPDQVASAVRSGGDVSGAIRGLASHNDGINAGRRNREADIYGGGSLSTMGGGNVTAGPDINRLYTALASGRLNPNQAAVVQAMIGQQQQANDPLRQVQLATAQAQLAQLQRPQGPEAPAGFRERVLLAQEGGLVPGSPEYQAYVLGNDSQPNAAEREIALLGEVGIPRDQAIRMTQQYTVSRDPVSGQAQLLDKATGQIVEPPRPPQPPSPPQAPQGSMPADTTPPPSGGMTFPGIEQAFGVTGAGRSVANTIADAVGADVPYPMTQEAQSDLNVLRESIRNDIVNGYGGRPSNWLMQQIDALIPRPGSPMTGPSGAQSSLQSLKRSMESELQIARDVLSRNLTPTRMIEAEDRVVAVESALARLNSALSAFPQSAPPAPTGNGQNTTSTGVPWSIVE